MRMNLVSIFFSHSKLVELMRGPGFEPGLTPRKGLIGGIRENNFVIEYDKWRNQFKSWLKGRVSEKYAKDLISYLDRYLNGKIIKNPHELVDLLNKVKNGKDKLTKAIRNLLNFYESFEIIPIDIIEKYRRIVKIPRTGIDGCIPNDDEIIRVYNTIEDERYRVLYKLLAFSGIRLVEGEELLRSYNGSKLQVKGKVAKYPIMLDRRTKRVFYAFFPSEFANELKRIDIPRNGLSFYLSKRNFNAKYLRKWNYNFLILNGVPESVADFIQGRASITVGSMHYLAKVKQADEWYNRVVDKLLEIFS